MTRSDLVKRLVQASGAPESQGRTLMESLLTRVDSVLTSANSSFEFPGLGTFKRSGEELLHSEEKSLEFHPASQFGSEILYFDVPGGALVTDELDKYFSPGLGKPVIPLKIEQSYEDYLYFAGTGLEQIVEAKVDRLLKTGKLRVEELDWSPLKLPQSESGFQWTTESSAFQEQLNKEPSPGITREQIPEKEFNPRLTQETILPHEQQKGWQEELVEEEILSSAPEVPVTSKPAAEIEDDISWDFGDLVPPEERSAVLSKPQSSPPKEKIADPTSEPKDEFGLGVLPLPGATTRELSIDISEFDEESSEIIDDHVALEDAEIEDFDLFFKKSLARNVLDTMSFEQFESENLSKDEVVPFPEELEHTDDELLQEEEDEEYNSDLPQVRAHKLTGFQKAEDEEEVPDYLNAPRKSVPEKAGWGKYAVSASFVTVLGLAAYVYMFGIPQSIKEYAGELMKTKKRVIPNVVERDYLFPVSYPYENVEGTGDQLNVPAAEVPPTGSVPTEPNKELPKEESKEKAKSDPPADVAKTKVQNSSGSAPANAAIPNPIREVLENQTPKVKKENIKQLRSNIFQDGSTYTVQVMSSPKREDSEREVNRLKLKGLNAYLTEADIPGKGRYYRVRVGGFSSLADAERFADGGSR